MLIVTLGPHSGQSNTAVFKHKDAEDPGMLTAFITVKSKKTSLVPSPSSRPPFLFCLGPCPQALCLHVSVVTARVVRDFLCVRVVTSSTPKTGEAARERAVSPVRHAHQASRP